MVSLIHYIQGHSKQHLRLRDTSHACVLPVNSKFTYTLHFHLKQPWLDMYFFQPNIHVEFSSYVFEHSKCYKIDNAMHVREVFLDSITGHKYTEIVFLSYYAAVTAVELVSL